jgi:hypothetical protein
MADFGRGSGDLGDPGSLEDPGALGDPGDLPDSEVQNSEDLDKVRVSVTDLLREGEDTECNPPAGRPAGEGKEGRGGGGTEIEGELKEEREEEETEEGGGSSNRGPAGLFPFGINLEKVPVLPERRLQVPVLLNPLTEPGGDFCGSSSRTRFFFGDLARVGEAEEVEGRGRGRGGSSFLEGGAVHNSLNAEFCSRIICSRSFLAVFGSYAEKISNSEGPSASDELVKLPSVLLPELLLGPSFPFSSPAFSFPPSPCPPSSTLTLPSPSLDVPSCPV